MSNLSNYYRNHTGHNLSRFYSEEFISNSFIRESDFTNKSDIKIIEGMIDDLKRITKEDIKHEIKHLKKLRKKLKKEAKKEKESKKLVLKEKLPEPIRNEFETSYIPSINFEKMQFLQRINDLQQRIGELEKEQTLVTKIE